MGFNFNIELFVFLKTLQYGFIYDAADQIKTWRREARDVPEGSPLLGQGDKRRNFHAEWTFMAFNDLEREKEIVVKEDKEKEYTQNSDEGFYWDETYDTLSSSESFCNFGATEFGEDDAEDLLDGVDLEWFDDISISSSSSTSSKITVIDFFRQDNIEFCQMSLSKGGEGQTSEDSGTWSEYGWAKPESN